MKQEFNPQDWLDKATAHPLVNSDQCSENSGDSLMLSAPHSLTPSPHHSFDSPDISSEVDTVVTRIEAAFEDITTSYADWRNLGFAFAHEFGESGRKNFHRVSRFYNGYTKAETDKQYDQCLKSTGHGITIKTFFHMAKQAGIDCTMARGDYRTSGRWHEGEMARGDEGVTGRSKSNPSTDQSINPSEGVPSPPHSIVPSSSSSEEDDPPDEEQPTLPDFVFDQLPDFFKRVVSRAFSKEERDILLLGSIVTLGSCLTTFTGKYDETDVYPNLFLYVSARASSGKGRLILCRNLVNQIHWEKLKQSQLANQLYEVELREYNALKGKDVGIEKPVKAPVTMHFLPANNSAAGLLQLLADNIGQGLIIETEGDTIAQALKSDLGNFSDVLRKDFHQEAISCYRKTDHEHVEITNPCFSMVLSSTMGQLKKFIVSTENGLSSRFMFYHMNLNPVWKDVFANSNQKSLKTHFNELGQDFYNFYCTLKEKDPMEFRLSGSQQMEFNAFFAQMQDKYLVLQGLDTLAIIRRLGLIAFRMMMILTAMRIPETGDFSTIQECRDEDFESVLAIIGVLVRHASYIVSQLPEEAKTERRGNKKERFYEGLPAEFTRKEFIELAKTLAIKDRTADNYIAAFCEKGLIAREQTNSYSKKISS